MLEPEGRGVGGLCPVSDPSSPTLPGRGAHSKFGGKEGAAARRRWHCWAAAVAGSCQPRLAGELLSEWFSRTLGIPAAAKAACWKWGWDAVVGSHTCSDPTAESTKKLLEARGPLLTRCRAATGRSAPFTARQVL